MCPDAHAHTHGLKGSASHPFASEHKEWTFNSNITKAPSHLGSKSVLISPDHTQSCLSYFLHLGNITGRVNPHTWHALKNHADLIIYSQCAHVDISDSKNTDFSFCLFGVFFKLNSQSAHSYLLCNIIRQKFKTRCLKGHWLTWSTCYFPVSWDCIVTTSIIFYICVNYMGKTAVLRADRFITDLSGDCSMNYSFFIISCLLPFTVVSDKNLD